MTGPTAPRTPPNAAPGPGPHLAQQLEQADALRQSGQWAQALQQYQHIQHTHGPLPPVTHNIAICHHALGDHTAAQQAASAAWQDAPAQWASGLLLARLQHQNGQGLQALHTLRQLHQQHPHEPQITLEAARRSLHTLGNPRVSARLVQHLLTDPTHGPQAQRMQLLAQLYDRDSSHTAPQLAQHITAHARTHLQLPPQGQAPAAIPPIPPIPAIAPGQPLRIGLVGNQLHSSPVYYLTIGALQALCPQVQWHVFDRSHRQDWATQAFQHIATAWHPAAQQDAPTLARTIAAQNLHGLIDLCGWMDPTTLHALSARPAPRQYKWVGGQSLTTGLDCFDGFITDPHHTPPGSQALYTEPLRPLQGGYASYSPPPYHPAPHAPLPLNADGRIHLGLVANPAKLSLAFLQHLRQHWPRWQASSPQPLQLHLIDKRYEIPALQHHLREQLPGLPLQFDTPAKHHDYLCAIGQLHAIIDTWPYSGGLTTLEAHSLGVPVYTRADGQLFCERHTHAHNQLLGLPQPDLLAPDFSPAHALHIRRDQLQKRAQNRQHHQKVAQNLWALLQSDIHSINNNRK